MATTNRELRLWYRILNLLARPRRMSRALKKAAGLKYCRHAGYGFKWFRGRRVPDPHEQAIMRKIVEWRHGGHSWYQIAAHLLRHHVLTADGREWSPSRVRRAYLAALYHQAGAER